MEFSIPAWKEKWWSIGRRIVKQRKSVIGRETPSERFNSESLEDRCNPSIALPIEGVDMSIFDQSLSAMDSMPAQDDVGPSDATALAESFQQLLDGPTRIVDLGGQTWIVPTRITITTKHSGKIIQNGTIKFTFEGTVPRMGGMEIVQGRKWYDAGGRTVDYPAGDINLTLRNLVFDGDFPYDFGLQARTEVEADRMHKGYNLITTITNVANYINLTDVRFQNSGNSAIAGAFRTFIAENTSADRIAKHVFGLRGMGGVKAHINGLKVTHSGNVIDFHNDGAFFDAAHPDVAIVRNIDARNIRGRSKIAGNNWSIYGSNWRFEQDELVNLNLYPAFDIAKNPRRFVVDGFVAINFPTVGIGTLSDSKTDGVIRLKNVYVRNSLAGIKVQQRLAVIDSEFEGAACSFRSSEPWFQSNLTATAPETNSTWASIYDQITALYARKNVEWGTHFTPRYWTPTPVRTLMQQ